MITLQASGTRSPAGNVARLTHPGAALPAQHGTAHHGRDAAGRRSGRTCAGGRCECAWGWALLPLGLAIGVGVVIHLAAQSLPPWLEPTALAPVSRILGNGGPLLGDSGVGIASQAVAALLFLAAAAAYTGWRPRTGSPFGSYLAAALVVACDQRAALPALPRELQRPGEQQRPPEARIHGDPPGRDRCRYSVGGPGSRGRRGRGAATQRGRPGARSAGGAGAAGPRDSRRARSASLARQVAHRAARHDDGRVQRCTIG